MLTPNKITTIFCLIDEILKGINHQEDTRRSISDSEIVITAIVAAKYFGGNQYQAIHFMKSYKYIPKMLNVSRFNRRLCAIGELLYKLFLQVGVYLQDVCCEMHYIIDFFPV